MEPSSANSEHFPLPAELLQRVLQHVDLPHRMGVCALVSRMWRAAANAATSIINLAEADEARTAVLMDWLQKHGGQCCKLSVNMQAVNRTDTCLPITRLVKLEELSLAGAVPRPCSRQLSSSTAASSSSSNFGSGRTGMPPPQLQQQSAAWKRLTSLQLQGCEVDWQSGLPPLPGLTNLRPLSLRDCVNLADPEQPPHAHEGAVQALDRVMGSALPWPVQLTQLQLKQCHVSDAGLAHVSCLQQLRLLMLDNLDITAASPASLPSNLTRMELRAVKVSSSELRLGQVTGGLQHLALTDMAPLDPSTLEGLWQLQHLYLDNCDLNPADGSVAVLLAALSRMMSLQHLELFHSFPDQVWPGYGLVPLSAYAALTASSQLTQLSIYDYEDKNQLPGDAYKHIFPTCRPLPDLRVLKMPLTVPSQAELVAREEQQQQQQQKMGQEIFDTIIGSFTGLQCLDLALDGCGSSDCSVVRLDGLTALAQGLTRLRLAGTVLTADDMPTFSQLSRLRELEFHDVQEEDTTYLGLLELTKLTQLEYVSLEINCDTHLWIENDAPAGSPPDVYQRLQELLEVCDSECTRLPA